VGGSSLQETRPASPAALADLRSRRSLLSSADLLQLAETLPLLRRRYNEQLQRAKIQLVDPRFKLASCRPLLALARAAAAALQQLYEALRLLDTALGDPQQPAMAPQIVLEALDGNEFRLEQIAADLHSLDAADLQSAWLRPLFEQLEMCARVSSTGWKTLAEHILSSAHAQADLASSLTIPGSMLKDYLAEIGPAGSAEVVGRGIEAARFVARFLARSRIAGIDHEILTLAALCQDCGLLLLGRSRGGRKSIGSAKQLRALHPSVGAGLIAGLESFSTALPLLVAQHHRRLNELHLDPNFRADDSVSRRQTRESRLLTIAVRLLELTEENRTRIVDQNAQPDPLAFSEAARQLRQETLRGDWDRSLADDLLASMGFDQKRQTEQSRMIDVRSGGAEGMRRRFDSAGEHLPEPNLGSAPQPREGRHVRASAR
jgi:hypothetical protein